MNQKKEIKLSNEEGFIKIVDEVIRESRLKETEAYIQHGITSVYRHSIAVAYYSCWLAERFHIRVEKKELIRGALLMIIFFMTGMTSQREDIFMALPIRDVRCAMPAGIFT